MMNGCGVDVEEAVWATFEGLHLASHEDGPGWDELNPNDPEEDGSKDDTRCDSGSELMKTFHKRGS
ncbi:hypothetical protein TIFTF001_028697 [Ficus carica]|uniref:Uncharacterized protein n=1 Tax=Ficus carica TaxID=3494 RepID=A0AA88IWX1_FICCA|nr:hypothetical protein TIFTF001_028697 [Ficus carica]